MSSDTPELLSRIAGLKSVLTKIARPVINLHGTALTMTNRVVDCSYTAPLLMKH